MKQTDTILAKSHYLSRSVSTGCLNNNILLVGSTGRDKTRDFIKPNLMQMNTNYVVLDSHGTLIREVGSMLEKNGYEIKVLNLADPEHSDRFNPFKYIQNEADVYKMLDYLMPCINSALTAKKSSPHYDPFYDHAAKTLLSAICFYLMESTPPQDHTIHNVLKLLRSHKVTWDEDIESTLDILFRDHRNTSPNSTSVQQYTLFKSLDASPATAASVLTTAAVYLQYFHLEEIDRLTSADNIDLEKLCYQKSALFIIPDPADRTKNWLMGFFFGHLLNVLTRRECKLGIRFILDDFLSAGYIPDFYEKLLVIQSHSRFMSCIISVQDEAQLYLEYGAAAQSIISNCDHYVFMGSSNIDLCNTVAKRLGKPFITGRSIRRLSRKKCVVISGRKGSLCRRYNIKKHPQYKEVLDPTSSIHLKYHNVSGEYDLEKKHSIPLAEIRPLHEDAERQERIIHRPLERLHEAKLLETVSFDKEDFMASDILPLEMIDIYENLPDNISDNLELEDKTEK